ncbi:MAG: hypothetical protein WC745_02355 [Patescibacteria group bacterium]|jgi:hypothetical protein
MFSTSRDILNLVLAASIGAVAFFLCWLMYYLAMSFRNVFKMSKDLRETVNEAKDTIRAFRGKVREAAAFFVMMNEGMRRVMDYIKEKGGRKGKRGNGRA